ncbi:rod shape-determining protein MreD [Cuneatibacter sp. NSJ-177]|uniref:rod shape-determining protein MreD n=1 Tax=Cuneatibacter sp. NSJ-177 TaxID=2931401 RepID=UPI001FD4DDF4|nr:rod shape-determining protein MreD [Cuneatibacter sp. NSJ-177]MCJ7836438.1 rod shape-determining protein MreD [Cuneatibacter sp. NSJ-177]
MTWKRILFYVVTIVASFMVQNNLFAASNLIDTVPNLLLIVTFTFGFLRGKTDGMLIGFLSGLLLDSFFGETLGFYALVYMVIGYGNGLLGQVFYTEFINMPVVLCILSDFLFNLIIYFFDFLMRGKLDILSYMRQVVLPEIVYTVLLTLVLYKFLRFLNTKFAQFEKRSAKKFV